MDVTLALTYQEQNDNKAIVLTDASDWDSSTTTLTSGDDNIDGDFYEITAQNTLDMTTIGSPDNVVGTRFVADAALTLGAGDILTPVTPTIAEIVTLTLDTTITGVDETATSKTQVDLVSEFGAFTVQGDLVFTITAALLGDTADTELIDGLYALVYTVTYDGDGVAVKTDTLSVTILVYGQVKVATYEKLREISTLYMCTNGCPSPEISEADLCGAYLSGIENSAFTAKTEELLSQLVVLDNMITNGSKITW
ncbi:unnamed protein product [marine sediment metagenome]|uniref:Uncharacterized protein n=1 Tax=marine sediment metagenome TaxID=412755 RepID=X0XC90_9ZZZZ